jgi:hypothetical protein
MNNGYRDGRDPLADFDYRGKYCVREALCANTAVHHMLSNKGLHDGSLITLNHRPATFRSADAGGIAYGNMPLDTAMAHAQASILSQGGLRLPVHVAERYREVLVTSYALSSALCVIQRGEEFDCVTKSREVLSDLFAETEPSVRKKGLQYYEDRLRTTPEELKSGQFKAVRVLPTDEGYRLEKVTLGSRNAVHLMPYYAVNHYAAALRRMLTGQKVKLVYSQRGAVHKLITTLNPEVVAKWLGGSLTDAEFAVEEDWRSPFSFGYFNLPDLLNEGQFVSVPLLHIHQVKPYE